MLFSGESIGWRTGQGRTNPRSSQRGGRPNSHQERRQDRDDRRHRESLRKVSWKRFPKRKRNKRKRNKRNKRKRNKTDMLDASPSYLTFLK